MITLQIPKRHLNALKLFTVQGVDVREYLRGIQVEISKEKQQALLVATNGHILAVSRVDCPTEADTSFIIPPEAFPKLGKPMSVDREGFSLIHFSDGTSIKMLYDAKFPDWRGVIPAEASGERADYNMHYLSIIAKACFALNGNYGCLSDLTPNGKGAAIVSFKDCPDFFAIIMPLNQTFVYQYTTPSWLQLELPRRAA